MAKYPVSDHYDGIRFRNETEFKDRSIFDIFRWMWEGGRQQWPEQFANTAKPQLSTDKDPKFLNLTFVNHASFLIQLDGINILTDPIFSKRASPLSWAGPKRVREPGLSLEALPPIHYVMVSHNHYDHMDLPSLEALFKKFHPQFFVPLGNAQLLEERGIKNVVELDWWQTYTLKEGGSMQLVPCQHWSARGLFDRFKSLWGGWVFHHASWNLLFVGDTGYSSSFKKIHDRLGPMDLSILPIGAYEPRWFMKDAHMNPEEAVLSHLDLKSHQSVASHFGSFQLTNEAMEDPPKALRESLKKHALSEKDFLILDVGESIRLEKKP